MRVRRPNNCTDAGATKHNEHKRGRAEDAAIELLASRQDDVERLTLRVARLGRVQRLQRSNKNTQRLRFQRLDAGVLFRDGARYNVNNTCLLYTSPSPRDS